MKMKPEQEKLHSFSDDVLKSDICRIVMTNTPTLFVTETCEVIEVSEKFRSCCADNASRTFFADIMNKENFTSLAAFCSEDVLKTKVFPIGYRRYRYAVAARLSIINGRCSIVALAENVKSALLLMSFFSARVSPERFVELFYGNSSDTEPFSSSYKMLMNPYDEIDEWESVTLLRNLAAKLSFRSELYPYKIKFPAEEGSRSHNIRVHSGGLSLIFTCILSVLGPASKNGELTATFDISDDNFGTTVSAALPYDIKLRGETDTITSLGEHLPGSFPYLAVASLAAAETDMYVKIKSDEKKLSFTFGSKAPADISHGFNYRDPEEYVESTVCSLFTLLGVLRVSVNEQKQS